MKSIIYNGSFWLVLLFSNLALSQLDSKFKNCNKRINVPVNGVQLFNTNNRRYAPGSACHHYYKAPIGYELVADCQLALDYNTATRQCTTEFFYVDREGDIPLRTSEYLCGPGNIRRISLFNELVLAYISNSRPNNVNSAAGSFSCTIRVQRATSCNCGWSVNKKIMNGVEAFPNEFVSMAGLIDRSTRAIAGGAVIISPRFCLTTAHSVYRKNTRNFYILVGDHDLSSGTDSIYSALYDINRFIIHPQYREIALNSKEENDIALLRMTNEIQFKRGVGPACLPFNAGLFTGTYVEAAGWGTISFSGPSPSRLQKASLNVISNSDCSARRNFEAIQEGKMCTLSPPRDTCTGDSGGGLYVRSGRLYVVGLISYGSFCGSVNPSVNTRLTSYITWIRSVTGETYC